MGPKKYNGPEPFCHLHSIQFLHSAYNQTVIVLITSAPETDEGANSKTRPPNNYHRHTELTVSSARLLI